jgi:hypothetical protein
MQALLSMLCAYPFPYGSFVGNSVEKLPLASLTLF